MPQHVFFRHKISDAGVVTTATLILSIKWSLIIAQNYHVVTLFIITEDFLMRKALKLLIKSWNSVVRIIWNGKIIFPMIKLKDKLDFPKIYHLFVKLSISFFILHVTKFISNAIFHSKQMKLQQHHNGMSFTFKRE